VTSREEEIESEKKDDISNPTAPTTAQEEHWREGHAPAARVEKKMRSEKYC
jgi:hypothetical protein